ncbi:dihydropteroate synthase [Bacillus badius]|uniref:Dihydropteroate synthase n=1 Tax=Bacillus badius TaxID=1455 RepID=A0ABR5APN0_BACBA|nr:dihydropteroate synthase [Bacillus badius]KIL75784.1 Dihydropteroate synthase [Bacillus badius]KZR56684.1 dihydropteroate synthase [Bacillus badius]MED4714933.1 dihydropteroate synthase [Bacillus badius]
MKVAAGPHELDFSKKTYIMGILNTTPDSFSDGGRFNERETAVRHAEKMVQEGADLIDIGGESTRPGYTPVSADEELKRVLPVIQAVAAHVNVPISIDTYKAETARQSIEAGAHIINDIWGAKKDPEIAAVAAEKQVPIILMHNRDNMNYHAFIREVLLDLYESINIAIKAGVPENQIILDPGIGFAKDMNQHMLMLQHLDQVAALGFPVLLGASRKRIVGHILDLPVEERMEGTGAICCFGIEKGCHILRVHDVKPISRMAKMTDALVGKG